MVMASISADLLAKGRRSITLVHRDVLVDQTMQVYQKILPYDAIGVVKASQNEIDKPVIIASVQTLSRNGRLDQVSDPALTLVDEAHVSMAPSYLRVFDRFGVTPEGTGYALGVSATWERSDGKGLGAIWEEVVFRRSFKWALDRGFIVPPRTLQLGGDFDLSTARIGSNGEYRDSDVEELVMIESLADTAVRGYQHCADGQPAALFAPTKASARFFGAALEAAGIKTAEVFDDTPRAARRFAFASHANGAVKVLLTCTALGIGWDAPYCRVALLVRPFNHLTPFIQTVSRVLTPWPGKTDGLILDFVGATDGKSMRSVIDLSVPINRETDPWQEDEEDFRSVSDSAEREHKVKKIDGMRQVDLFAGTGARWLRTKHGVPFVSTREHLYFVTQVDGVWNVGQCDAHSIQGGQWLAQGVLAADALEIASEAALDNDPSIAAKSAPWRQTGRPATDAQCQAATRLGLDVSGMSRAEASDGISVAIATRVLSNVKGSGIG
jgi:superfamily II DNA or RNA helicase